MEKMIINALLVAAIMYLVNGDSPLPDSHLVESCVDVTIPECLSLTSRLNLDFNYSTTPELEVDRMSTFRELKTLFNSECSEYIHPLVCFVLEPSCHEHVADLNGTQMIINFVGKVCRDFCNAVKEECSDYAAFWILPVLDCELLPQGDMCFTPPPDNFTRNISNGSNTTVPTNATEAPTKPPTKPSIATCPGRLVPHQGVSYGNVDECAAPCHYLYEEDSYSSGLVTFLFVLWSLLSLLAVVSFVSFLLTWKHYSHIEQPYYFVVLCHCFMFLAFVIRLGTGHDAMVCDTRHMTSNGTALITEDVSNAACTVVFIIINYSLIAISMWFVNLAFAVCTLKLFKWRYYFHAAFHIAGWGIPFLFVIVACAQKVVSGDALLGLCQLDYQYISILVVPMMTCATLGFLLLVISVVQVLFCSRAGREVQSRRPEMLWRSLLFALVLLIEITVVMILYLTELVMYEHWETYYTECVVKSPPQPDCSARTFTRPSYTIPVIRFSVISLVGAISIAWPLSRKVTWLSWRESILLLYQKVVDKFGVCSWSNKRAGVLQLETTV